DEANRINNKGREYKRLFKIYLRLETLYGNVPMQQMFAPSKLRTT
ncbi:6147_t:CDS:1, partial [Racocetra persica]